jgi:thioredoxin-like negative regulator of GroEL
MSDRQRGFVRWGVLGLGLALAAAAVGSSAVWLRARSRRLELEQARQAMADQRFSAARERLLRIAGQWPDDGEVLLLLGECELGRGRAEDALAVWAKVPRASASFAQAALLLATHSMNRGKYTPAEKALVAAMARPDGSLRYDLERALSRLYRFEGRLDDVRRVLRASWCRSPDPAGVLKELWLLDHSPMPVEAIERFLGVADADDDRVWLGRAHHAILTGRFDVAADWLARALRRRPEDPPLWKARLELARAAEDVDGLRAAAAHLAEGDLEAGEVRALRAWLAGHLSDRALERRELAALIQEEPGDARAIERLAVLMWEAGQAQEAEPLRRRKAEVDRSQDRFRKVLLEPDFARHAGELAELSRLLGRPFDAQGWAMIAEAMARAPERPPSFAERTHAHQPPPALDTRIVDRALALSAPWAIALGARSRPAGPALAERLADLDRPGADRGRPSAPGPVTAEEPAPRFVDDAEAAGLRFTFDNGHTAQHLLPETMSGGVALLDYDGDGWLDVYCIQGGPLPLSGTAFQAVEDHGQDARATPGDRLFRSRGDGTFEDATERARIAAIAWGRGYGLGATVGDYDNDGHPDLFITRLESYALYRNRGDGTFEDVTERAGLAGRRDNPTSAAFADLDNDGDLDLYVCHYMLWDPEHPRLCLNDRGDYFYCDPSKVEPAPDHLFRNDGGRFVDVTDASGLAESHGRGLGVVAADLDDDHRIDLYVANDGTANYFFRNQGSFRFQDAALEAGVAGSASGGYQAGMGIACGDLDGDGRPDLLVTNFYGEGTTYYQNLGRGLFADRSHASGIGLATRYLLGFGIALADVANTGRPDVMIANGHVNDNRPYYPYAMPARLYRNRPDGHLVDISHRAGPPWEVPRVGRGLATGDLDNDGRCDAVLLAQNESLAYFHNQSEPVGRFVTFLLEGTKSNRDGVGARVTVTAGGRRQVAQRLGGGSYQSANDPRLHFGLAASDRLESVEVRWPSGQVDRWSDLPAGTGYRLREGDRTAHLLAGFRQPRHP